MANGERPQAIIAAEVPESRPPYGYPEPYGSRVRAAGRMRRPLGEVFGLTNFGVNLTRLPPGALSALRHTHTREDELVYILEGEPTLVTGAGETRLHPGMCAGFKAGSGNAHHLVNRGDKDAVFLEIGDRDRGDTVVYPDDDLGRALSPEGRRIFVHRDGSPY
ncbi:MAG TPA: cupin domain-containing protein [Stellaceae bacterium]|nr:cupin domain-containing protein [Stellaceae bacterium]